MAENLNTQNNEGGAVAESANTEQNPTVSNEILNTAELAPKDKQLLEALDEILEKRTRDFYSSENPKRPMSASERVTKGIVKKGVGIISLGLILITFGVIMICCLFSQAPDYLLPLKLSPVAAILLGIEILVTMLINHGRIKIHVISVIISGALVAGCCTMGVILNRSYKEDKIEYNNRTIAAEIYDRSYKELRYITDIEAMEIEVDLNPDGTGVTKGLDALSSGDKVVINIDFGGVYAAPKAFAADCKKIIEGYRIMGIEITDFHFTNQSNFHSYKLDVLGRYTQDYSEAKLTELVNHIYLEDTNYLEDLDDLENSSSTN